MLKFLFKFSILLILFSIAHGCNHRDYGNGATVCVCSEQLGCDNLVLNISRVKGIVTSYRTTKAGDRFRREELRFIKFSPKIIPLATVVLNRNKKYQKVVGFGGAFTDSTGINIDSLSAGLQDRLIRDYFAEDGLEYRIGRIPIGGTDFSTRPYTYDDNPEDESLSSFALQPEDFIYKIPYIKMAQNVSSSNLKLLGSSWSPPGWMKTNDAISVGYLKGEPGGIYYELYAKYLVRFVQEYNRNNVTIWGLTMQNEPVFPGFIINSSVNSLLLNAQMQRDFLKLNLGPELKLSGYSDLKVMIFDENLQVPNFTTLVYYPIMEDYVTTILEDSLASNYSSGIAFHWYFTQGNRTVLDQLAAKFPDKFLLGTEACEIFLTQRNSLGSWTTFDSYADDIISDLNHYTTGWIDWNMVLNTDGGPNWLGNAVNAPVIVNETAQEYYKQPFFYALGHFSKFLVPDSVRIKHTILTQLDIEDNNFLVTVFERPDSATVLTVLNKYNQSIALLLNDPKNGFLPIWVKPNSLQSLIWY